MGGEREGGVGEGKGWEGGRKEREGRKGQEGREKREGGNCAPGKLFPPLESRSLD